MLLGMLSPNTVKSRDRTIRAIRGSPAYPTMLPKERIFFLTFSVSKNGVSTFDPGRATFDHVGSAILKLWGLHHRNSKVMPPMDQKLLLFFFGWINYGPNIFRSLVCRASMSYAPAMPGCPKNLVLSLLNNSGSFYPTCLNFLAAAVIATILILDALWESGHHETLAEIPQRLQVQRIYHLRKFVVYHRLLKHDCFEGKEPQLVATLERIGNYCIRNIFLS